MKDPVGDSQNKQKVPLHPSPGVHGWTVAPREPSLREDQGRAATGINCTAESLFFVVLLILCFG